MKKFLSFILAFALLFVIAVKFQVDARQTATSIVKKEVAVSFKSATEFNAVKHTERETLTLDTTPPDKANQTATATTKRITYENKRKFAFTDYPLLS